LRRQGTGRKRITSTLENFFGDLKLENGYMDEEIVEKGV
jgi:hypothetical protein